MERVCVLGGCDWGCRRVGMAGGWGDVVAGGWGWQGMGWWYVQPYGVGFGCGRRARERVGGGS